MSDPRMTMAGSGSGYPKNRIAWGRDWLAGKLANWSIRLFATKEYRAFLAVISRDGEEALQARLGLRLPVTFTRDD